MGKKEPTHKIKLGRIRAAIWANTAKDGDVWFNVEPYRIYKNGDKWEDTASFRRDDLPIVRLAIDMAYDWIWRQEVALEESSKHDASQ